MIANSKLAPEMLPKITATPWLDKTRDASEPSVLNCSTVFFVAVVVAGTVLVESMGWLLVIGLSVLKSKSSNLGGFRVVCVG